MRRRGRAGAPLQQATVDELRHRARHDDRYRRPLGIALMELAMTATTRRPDATLAILGECLTVLRTTEPPGGMRVDMALVSVLGLLGSEQAEHGQRDEATAALEEAIALVEDYESSPACTQEHRGIIVNILVLLARCQELAGDDRGARDLADRAFLVLEPIAELPGFELHRTALLRLDARLRA